jgi:hypothetical protein
MKTAFERSVEKVNIRALAEGADYVVVWHHKKQEDLKFVSQYGTFEEMNREAFFWVSEGYKKHRQYYHGPY